MMTIHALIKAIIGYNITMDFKLDEIFTLMPELGEEGKQLIQKAYNFAFKAYAGNLRKSGEP